MTPDRTILLKLSEQLLQGLSQVGKGAASGRLCRHLCVAMGEPHAEPCGLQLAGHDVFVRATEQLRVITREPGAAPLYPFELPLSLLSPDSTVSHEVADHLLTQLTGRPRGLWLADYSAVSQQRTGPLPKPQTAPCQSHASE